jgi:hypothetical protein
LVCKLEKDGIFSHVVDDTEALHRKMMVMSGSYVINSELEHRRKNEVMCCKVMIMSNSHFVSFQFNDIYLKETFFVKPLSQFSNHDPDKFLSNHDPMIRYLFSPLNLHKH